MKVFVTGSTGFIGAAVVKALNARGLKTISLTRKSCISTEELNHKVVGDLNDLANLTPVFRKGIDCIVHTASLGHHHKQALDGFRTIEEFNKAKTLELANLAASHNVKRFIFISSIKANGESTPRNKPFEPDTVRPPVSSYGRWKHRTEVELLDIAKKTGLEIVIIRPPIVYGPGVKSNFRNLIRLVKTGLPLPFGAIKNKRSFISLTNLVDFIAINVNYKATPNAANEIFLISDGEDLSTPELLRKIAIAYKVHIILVPVPVNILVFFSKVLRRISLANKLIDNLQINNIKAKKYLRWEPPITVDQQLMEMANYDRLHKR